ncbi:MAG UNVERIFIED_CONTAM: GIY-YIG nuclease family protein [Planctomycetaceae bacterium]|jgi:hypothetical protein
MSKPIEEILAPKPVARPRIYAYSIADAAHAGQLKVGQTTRDVKQRVSEQLKTANIKNYRIEIDESAARDDGTVFRDHEVRAALVKKKIENVELEWMRCTVADVLTVLTELRQGQKYSGTHHETFPMRREQAEAVEKTFAYYQSIWAEDKKAVPRFLWNAKMRFGKTFTTYQLAKKLARSVFWSSPSSPPWKMPGKRICKATRTSMAGNTCRAVRAATRRKSRIGNLWSTSVPFRIC